MLPTARIIILPIVNKIAVERLVGLLLMSCLLIAGTNSVFGQATEGRKVWVSPELSISCVGKGSICVWGNGTYEDPWYGDFDYIMENLVQGGDKVRLLAGIFYTRGCQNGGTGCGWKVKSNTAIIGAGAWKTTIELRVINQTNPIEIVGTDGGSVYNVLIQDLGIDGQATGSELHKRQAVALRGSYNKIQRVEVVNCIGPSQEAFLLYLGGGISQLGNSIEDCKISEVKGNYISAISVQGQGYVKNNFVDLPDITLSAGDNIFGINLGSGNNLVVEGNFVSGGTRSIHYDTDDIKNVIVKNNILLNARSGIHFQTTWDVDNVFICDNIIEMNPDESGASEANAIMLWHNSPTVGKEFKNIYVTGNTIRYVGGIITQPYANNRALNIKADVADRAGNFIFANNRYTSNLVLRLPEFEPTNYAENVQVFGNTYLNGDDVSDVNQVAPVASLKRRLITSSFVQLNGHDRYVAVNFSSQTIVRLPDGNQFPGKEYLFTNENPSGGPTMAVITRFPTQNIRDQVTSSNIRVLNPGESVSIVSDGANTWYAK